MLAISGQLPYNLYLLDQSNRGVAQSGSAGGLGPSGRRFESCLPDHTKSIIDKVMFFAISSRIMIVNRVSCDTIK